MWVGWDMGVNDLRELNTNARHTLHILIHTQRLCKRFMEYENLRNVLKETEYPYSNENTQPFLSFSAFSDQWLIVFGVELSDPDVPNQTQQLYTGLTAGFYEGGGGLPEPQCAFCSFRDVNVVFNPENRTNAQTWRLECSTVSMTRRRKGQREMRLSM